MQSKPRKMAWAIQTIRRARASLSLARMFHILRDTKAPALINTPLQRGGCRRAGGPNRFNGFHSVRETVETVRANAASPGTPLKQGVNGRRLVGPARKRESFGLAFASLLFIAGLDSSAIAQGTTAFTYQGRLNLGTNAASGNYDLRFAACDALYNGNTVAGPTTNLATLVTAGFFTVRLDFGAGLFAGSARWLDIGVRTNGNGAFTALTPRQNLTPVPYALYAPQAGVAATATQISGLIASSNLAPGAAAANLAASGQAAVPSGGIILSASENSALVGAGYVKLGKFWIDDAWQPRTKGTPPACRMSFTTIWTGSEMIIWGGYTNAEQNDILPGDGARYNPVADSWTPVTTVGVPAARFDHTAVWTGTEMIVWGGQTGTTPAQRVYTYTNGGARYNPTSDTWRPISASNAPTPRSRHNAVWTGTEMIVWGGNSNYIASTDGGRYNPFADTWAPMSTNGAPAPSTGAAAVWSGGEMVVWGGLDASYTKTFNGGGRYNPVANTWRPTGTNGAPAGRYGYACVWTGNEMIIWGGQTMIGGTSVVTNDGGRYNPVADTWTTIPTSGGPAARTAMANVWTGSDMIVWGGGTDGGGRFNPATSSWTLMATNLGSGGRYGSAAVWTGNEMILWGGDTRPHSTSDTYNDT